MKRYLTSVAYWAMLVDWSDGLRRLGCGPLAISPFFSLLLFFFFFHFLAKL
jgi:hypothetical protein